jgi:hypothetical protein
MLFNPFVRTVRKDYIDMIYRWIRNKRNVRETLLYNQKHVRRRRGDKLN